MAPKSIRFKCSKCGRSPGSMEKSFNLCSSCKGRRYCSKACQKADRENHKADCNTIVLLAKPDSVARMPDFIKQRDKASVDLAESPDAIFHLKMLTPWHPEKAKYLGPFIELGGLQQKIHEATEDMITVIPSSDFLTALLDAPTCGIAGVEELRVPLVGLEGIVRFQIALEKNPYINFCVRKVVWSLQKLMYVVVIEKHKFLSNANVKANAKAEGERRYVAGVEVEGTFASSLAAKACIQLIAETWTKEDGPNRVETQRDGPELMRASRSTREGLEIQSARIITSDLFRAGVTCGSDGRTVEASSEPGGFAKRLRIVEHA